MTCKDCIHRELCADYVSSLAKVQNADVKYISQWLDEIEGKKNQTDNECEHFADRSRFVELPCKVGDRLYVPISKSKYIAEYVVIAFWVEESGTIIRIVDTRFFTVNILWFRDIGSKAFLTKEAAEQALKERENDGK